MVNLYHSYNWYINKGGCYLKIHVANTLYTNDCILLWFHLYATCYTSF